MQLERANNDEIAKEISLKKQEVRKVRREMGGINAAQENNELILKQVKILENRLHKALVKFNEALSYVPLPYSQPRTFASRCRRLPHALGGLVCGLQAPYRPCLVTLATRVQLQQGPAGAD